VRGISFQATESDLMKFFSSCGEVLSVNLLHRPDGSSKGVCFVRFKEERSVTLAVELNGSEHMGRTLTVERTRDSGNGPGSDSGPSHRSDESNTVFVGNLSF
jgi:RNA recognition motif-containing protein